MKSAFLSFAWGEHSLGRQQIVKPRVSEIDLSQPRHKTFFGDVTMGQWRHNYAPFMWPNYPLEVIGIYVHINTQSKESLTQICRRLINVHRVWYFCTYLYDLSLNWWHALFCIANNRHGVTITTHAIKRHYLIWMTTVRQPSKRRCSCVLT